MKDFMETHPSVDQCQPHGGAKGSPKVLTIYCDGDMANIMDTRPTVVDTKPQPHGGAARKSPGKTSWHSLLVVEIFKSGTL